MYLYVFGYMYGRMKLQLQYCLDATLQIANFSVKHLG